MAERKIRGVLFDMDGLLVDSERVGAQVMIDAARRQNVPVSLDVVKSTLGTTLEKCREIYARHYPALQYEPLRQDFCEEMHRLARAGGIPLKPGAKALLDALRARDIPCAIASSSGPETVQLYLEKAGVLDAFSALITGGMAQLSKPEPDIFLLAAQRLSLPPEDCLVLEDSANGVRAGRAAGCQVFMVPDMIPYTPALAPFVDRVLPTLADVIPLLPA